MKFTIKLKLALGFGALIAMTCGVGLFAMSQMDQINAKASEISSDWLPSQGAANGIKNTVTELRVAELQHVAASEEAALRQWEKVMDDNAATNTEFDAIYKKLLSNPEEQALFEDYTKKYDTFFAAHKRFLDLSKLNKDDEARQILNGDGLQAFMQVQDAADKLVALQKVGADKASADAQQVFSTASKLVIGSLIGAALIGLAFAFWITMSIVRGLRSANTLVTAVAAGDLTATAEVRGNDEIAEMIGTLNAMVKKLKSIVSEVQTAASNVASGSHQLSATAEQLSQGSTEQASATEEASAAMEEMASTIKQ
jgi:methyl-accepting chemotaxis protein